MNLSIFGFELWKVAFHLLTREFLAFDLVMFPPNFFFHLPEPLLLNND